MQTEQALNCLRALTHFERHISFEHVNESVGYLIRIEGLNYEPDRKLILNAAKTLGLIVKEDAVGITIQ